MKGYLKSKTSNNSVVGLTFGALKVLNDHGYGNIECKCICGSVNIYNKYSVTSGHTSSCGCIRDELRYISRWGNVRSTKQIEACKSEGALRSFILDTFDKKPTIFELSEALGISYSRTVNLITDKNRDIIYYHPAISKLEKQIVSIVESILEHDKIVYNIRNVIKPYELDIYIPEKKIAIEFNGNYWHSAYFKDKYYHQNKSVECIKHGIRLIHIYEYELTNLYDEVYNRISNALKNNEHIKNTNDYIELSLDSDNIIKYINNGYRIVSIEEPEPKIIDNTYVVYNSGTAILCSI